MSVYYDLSIYGGCLERRELSSAPRFYFYDRVYTSAIISTNTVSILDFSQFGNT